MQRVVARDAKLYVRIADDGTAVRLAHAGYMAAIDGDWLHIFGGTYDADHAHELAKTLATTTVWWSIDSGARELSLVCFHYGARVRELAYAGRWTTIAGRSQPFEA